MFLNVNIEHIPIEVPALSTEQALQAVPRRLSNRRRRWPPLVRARRGLRAKRACTPPTRSTQGGRGLRAKRALTSTAATPQGEARTRILGDEWGAAVDILCCNVYASSSLFCFFWAMQMTFSFVSCVLVFLHLAVGYAKPCWRDGDARISSAVARQYRRIN